MQQNFIEIWKQNPNQEFYGSPILTRKDIIETHKFATEQEMLYLESFEPAKMFYTELYLLNTRKRKLGSRSAVGLRNLQDWEEKMNAIEEDIGAIEHELRLKIEEGRIREFNAERRRQNEQQLKEFDLLLKDFIAFYARIEASRQSINDLIAVGIASSTLTQNGLKYMQAMLNRQPIHDKFIEHSYAK